MFLKLFLPIYCKLTLSIDGADKYNIVNNKHIYLRAPQSNSASFVPLKYYYISNLLPFHFSSPSFILLVFPYSHPPTFYSFAFLFWLFFHIVLQKIKYPLDFGSHFVSFIYNFVCIKNCQ